ncbi:hypothetical protein A0H81_14419 [Grifola frondosa]|uniref:Uncharacterized protein n=1 Tax=Grifola frondosa TaxID=5627 RepID=A0A1C7LRY6_GRIFR|nr:hypothetical protein A0H81_14419 [Grifola frondosa]
MSTGERALRSAGLQEQKKFEKTWKQNVEKRWKTWKKNRQTQSQYMLQLEWEANVVEYVSHVSKETAGLVVAGSLRKEIPLFGPHFLPPTYLQVQKRDAMPNITPDVAYLKPLHIIHPFYYPELTKCPQCNSTRVSWNGWTSTGHRRFMV